MENFLIGLFWIAGWKCLLGTWSLKTFAGSLLLLMAVMGLLRANTVP